MTVRILHGDCRELLQSIETESVDCIIADPPYGETSLAWDRWPHGWPTAIRRVLKPTGSMWVFGSLRMFLERRDEFDARGARWRIAQEVIWEKHNGSNSFADRFRRVHELAVQFYQDDAPWAGVYKKPVYTNDAQAKSVRRKQKAQHWSKINGHHYVSVEGGPKLQRSVIYMRSEHGRAINETQKPAELVRMLLEYSCPPGGVVLDPFFGSGTTGIAGRVQGVHVIGMEMRDQQIMAATERIHGDAPLLTEVMNG